MAADRARGVLKQLRALLRKRAVERELDEELDFHLALEAERLRQEGLPAAEARRRARLAFGGVDRFAESVRDARWTTVLEELQRDVRHGARSLLRAPAFALAAVLTLALGVGANTAMFSVLNATLLRPLPFAESDRLVAVYQVQRVAGSEPRNVRWSYPEFAALRDALRSLETVVAYRADDANLAVPGAAPVRARIETASPGYFETLRVPAVLGRTLRDSDEQPDAAAVAVLSESAWQRHFGADPAALGRRLLLNDVPVEVVGVAAADFAGLSGEAEAWIAHRAAAAVLFPEHLTIPQHFLSVVGRLRPGVELRAADAEARAAGARSAEAARSAAGATQDGAWGVAVMKLESARHDGGVVRAQLVLGGAVVLVLLIAVVNLTGLLVARAVARVRETAVRTALGAGRGRLLRQAAAESAVLGLLGAAGGVLLATWSLRLLQRLAPERLAGSVPGLPELGAHATPSVDWRVLGFAAALALVAAAGAGLLAAWRAAPANLDATLRSGARGNTMSMGTLRRPTLLSSVAIAQVACSLVLLVGAGLLLRGFQELRALHADHATEQVLSFRVSAPESRYGGPGAAALLQQQLLERVQAVPGVLAATVDRCTPFMRCSEHYVYRQGYDEADAPRVGRHYVGPDHFRTLGIPLLRGRGLTAQDRAGAPRVAVISETAARTLWPGEDPIGQRVHFSAGGGFASPDSLTEIVGIAGDVVYDGRGEHALPDFYTSYQQHTLPAAMIIVRAAAVPATLVPALRQAVADVDATLPIHDVRTLRERAAEARAAERFSTVAITAFAVLGLLLAAVGIYGVMAYTVHQRRRETGIRLALGASPRRVLRDVVRQGVAHAAVGLLVGALAAVLLARTLAALLPEAASLEPGVLAAALLLLLGVATLTAYLPARAAARTDPVHTLGAE